MKRGVRPMEERVLISLLLDFYGALLTERQRQCLSWHHEDDMSLAEIAETLGVSRQAVHDNMQRARQLLDMYESKLHLVTQYEKREHLLSHLKTELSKLDDVFHVAHNQVEQVTQYKNSLYELVAQMEG